MSSVLPFRYNQFNDDRHKSTIHLAYDEKYGLPALITGNQKFKVKHNNKRKNVYVNTFSEIGQSTLYGSDEINDYLETNEVVNVSRRVKRMNAQDRYDKFKRKRDL